MRAAGLAMPDVAVLGCFEQNYLRHGAATTSNVATKAPFAAGHISMLLSCSQTAGDLL